MEHIVLPEWALIPDIGLYMDQVITFLERARRGTPGAGEISRSMVNNYVRAGLISRPVGKKYDRAHLARLLMILVLKQALTLEEIARVLDMLCGDDVQAGYARFCAEVQGLSRQLCAGEGARSPGEETPSRIVTAAVTAAVCTMHARTLLAGA